MTEAQWGIVIKAYMDEKLEKYDETLSYIEYLAQLTSPSPKAISEIILKRRKKMDQIMGIEKDPNLIAQDDTTVVRNYDVTGEVLNTSFEDQIRKQLLSMGKDPEATLKNLMGEEYTNKKQVVYTVDKDTLDFVKKSKDDGAKLVQQNINPNPVSEKQQKMVDNDYDTISF